METTICSDSCCTTCAIFFVNNADFSGDVDIWKRYYDGKEVFLASIPVQALSEFMAKADKIVGGLIR